MARRRTSRRPEAPRLPLRLRLPNPPAVFVGREADRAWLEEATRRAPVTLVTGPGGLGKTALVLQTLHGCFAKHVPRTISIDVPPGQPAAQLRHEILRALAEAQGDGEVDWAELQGEPEMAMGLALDLAEAGPWWIVLDDVYQGDTEETDQLLVQLASFARKSRWIATSRLTPRLPTLASQILTLDAMPDEELEALARAFAPQADGATVRQAIAAASGSPWLLHQLLVTGAVSGALGEGGLLHGLPEDAAAFLRALALVEVPLPLGTLALFAPEPAPETLQMLERRGLLHRSAEGWRLHDVARGMLLGPTRDALRGPAAAHAAAVLAQQDHADAQLEAARLLATVGRIDALEALLDRRADRLVAQGYAPRLWKILRDTDDPRLGTWQLRCAAELGNPTALAEVRAPSGDEVAEVLAWARTLRAQGDVEDAATRARQVLAHAEASPGSAAHAEASFLLAACARHRGRPEESLAVLEAVQAADEATALRRDAGMALGRVLAGESDRDVELATLRRRVLALPADPETACEIAEALLCVGRLEEASEVLAAARSTPRGARPALLTSRQASLLAARIHLATGDLESARRLADEVRGFARGSSLLLPSLHVVDVTRRLLSGELEGLEPLLAACRAEVEGIDAAMDLELAGLAARLRLSGAVEDGWSPPEGADGRAGREAGLWETLRRVRQAGALVDGAPAGADVADADRVQSVIVRLVHAAVALADGDFARATTHAEEAVRRASRWGLAALEAEARAAQCDALLCAERSAALVASAAALRALGERVGSARFVREASFYTRAATERRIAPGTLEALAAQEHGAPVAARRSQAVLGGSPSLDHVDLRVLEALAISGRTPTVEPVGVEPPRPEGQREAPWEPGWGIDDSTGAVWLPGGREVDLSARGLPWRILETIAAAGGEVTREQLVLQAWSEPEYHPLRHDGRVHVAIRKVRELIEDSVASPTRLLTTEDGYRLGPNARLAR